VSYGESTVGGLGGRGCRMALRRDFLVPAFHRGVLKAGIEAIGGKQVRVEAIESGFLDSFYEIAWE